MTTESFAIKEKLESLRQALLEANPMMPTILHEIHSTLKSQPHVVTLLSEEDIATIVKGLDKQTGDHLTKAIVDKKPNAGEKKRLKAVTMTDLF
jgi:hypothetical protein